MSETKDFMCYLCSKRFQTDDYTIETIDNLERTLGICPFCKERYNIKVFSDARVFYEDVVCDESISNLYEVYSYDIPQHTLFSSLPPVD